MRSKTIISILAFAAAFGFSAYFASFFLPETVKVENFYYDDYVPVKTNAVILNLLRQDDRNGNARSSFYYDSEADLKTYVKQEAKFVSMYVDKSSSLSTSNLPSDFRIAWREHLKAWRNYSDFMNKSAKTPNLDADEFREQADELTDEINSTFEDVLYIGENYQDDLRYEIQQ